MSDEAKRYSMDEVAWEAGISYSTLLAFLRKHGDRIPSEIQGKNRFFPPRAIEVVREIARENTARRGRNLRLRSREKAASDRARGLGRGAEEAISAYGPGAALLTAEGGRTERAVKVCSSPGH